MSKLLLIDALNLFYRAFYAFPQTMKTSSGELTNAAYGFAQMLLTVLERERPDFAAIALEGSGGSGTTFRHKEYSEYKANRSAMPAELRGQVHWIRDIAGAMGIPVFEEPGFEADDVIGSLSNQANWQELETVIVSGDRDLLQLVNSRTRVAAYGQKFSEFQYFDQAAVKEKYGVDPHLFASYKALVGDPSDNIPGVRGIGPVAAAKLVGEYGTLDNILFRLASVQPQKVQNFIRADRDNARMSYRLATIVKDLPVNRDFLRDCRYARHLDPNEIGAVMMDLQSVTMSGKYNKFIRELLASYGANIEFDQQGQQVMF
jgi:DNA polymerase-1